jgi:hypothetical protein
MMRLVSDSGLCTKPTTLGIFRRDACNAAESDMVAVNRVADLAIRQTVAHQTFYCGSRLCGEFYRSGEGKNYGLIF